MRSNSRTLMYLLVLIGTFDAYLFMEPNSVNVHPERGLIECLNNLPKLCQSLDVIRRNLDHPAFKTMPMRSTRSFLNKLLQNKDDDLDLEFLFPDTEHHQQKYKSEQKMYEFFGSRGKREFM